jgi:pimeloyl-ACP methyl ester carboxylesterase
MARNRFATSQGRRIAYELRGVWRRSRPWLVMVQGLGFDRAGWAPVVPGLCRRFRLVLIDNRGSGRSDPAPAPFPVADLARDVITVLDAAGIARAHVLGISLGGMVAQELAISYPQRVDRLVLVATTPGWPYGHPMPAPFAALMMASGRMDHTEALRRHVENALSASTVVERPKLVERLIRHQQAHPTEPAAWSALAAAGAGYSGQRRQARITARTLVLHGDDDTVVDPRNGKLLAERIPDSTLVTLAGLGHLLFWEDPARFVELVTSFLTQP